MIDGCRRSVALLCVVVPMIVPSMIAVALLAFLSGWNDPVWALTLTISPAMLPNPPGFVLTYVGQFEIYWNQLVADSVMVNPPTILVFVFLQRYLVQGLTAGAIKS